MNHKQQVAAMHARELRIAKDDLLIKVNQKLQEARSKGYYAEVTPQVQRLVGLDKYRQRDVAKMQQLASNPDKLQEYIYVVYKSTGATLSGEKAIRRYELYKKSKIAKPVTELEVGLTNVMEDIESAFPDLSILEQFRDFILQLITDPESAIDETYLRALHPNWSSPQYRGNIHCGIEKMAADNKPLLYDIKNAFEHLVDKEGGVEAAKRLRDNWSMVQDECIKAAVAYYEVAALAAQHIVILFTPTDRQPGNIRHRLADLQDSYESQFDYEE